MELDPLAQIQSISDFRTKTGKMLKTLTRDKTILLTQHGKTCAVLMDPAAYEYQAIRLRLAEKILKAHREFEGGLGVTQAEVEKQSKAWVK